jgi:hypothetical protein
MQPSESKTKGFWLGKLNGLSPDKAGSECNPVKYFESLVAIDLISKPPHPQPFSPKGAKGARSCWNGFVVRFVNYQAKYFPSPSALLIWEKERVEGI